MGHRRKAREYALQGLYQFEMRKSEGTESTGPLYEDILSLEWIDRDVPPETGEFTISLLEGTLKHIETIDGLINSHSKNWKFERLTAVDKSILRLCIFEIIYLSEIPVAVTINEGIELGKLYGGESSGQFINGILDAIKKSEINGGKKKG